jgi:transcriptional regulator with XRE-family HTH domain
MTPTDLIDWRCRLGLTQQQAADRLGCARRSVQNWEQPGAKIPGYIALACAAVAYGLPPIGSRARGTAEEAPPADLA